MGVSVSTRPDFYGQYRPLTSMPFHSDETYQEVPPGLALRPFVRCFWGSRSSFTPDRARLYQSRLVVPDGCSDLILTVEETTGEVGIRLVGLDTKPYYSNVRFSDRRSIFAVRFYFWALPYLGIRDQTQLLEAGQGEDGSFPGLSRFLTERGFAQASFEKRMKLVENYLLSRGALEADADLMNACEVLIKARGAVQIRDAAASCGISTRKMERLFDRCLGATPKFLADLVRYQALWRDLLEHPGGSILDEVYALGFYDQAHLHRNFRRFHGMSVEEGLSLAAKGPELLRLPLG